MPLPRNSRVSGFFDGDRTTSSLSTLTASSSKLTLIIFMAKFSPVFLERTRFTTANPPVPKVSKTSYLSSGWPASQFVPSAFVETSVMLPLARDLREGFSAAASAEASLEAMQPMANGDEGDQEEGARGTGRDSVSVVVCHILFSVEYSGVVPRLMV